MSARAKHASAAPPASSDVADFSGQRAWYEGLVERDMVPDAVLRVGIRRLVRARLQDEELGSDEKNDARKREFVAQMKASPIAVKTRAANEQHYEVPTAFFKAVLGKRLKYSSGYWRPGVDTLDQAEDDMLRLTCERARLKNGQQVLELGCGWGSLSLYMAERYPESTITGVSNSRTQRQYIESQIADRGLRNLKIVTADMNDFAPAELYDRVVSVEMFEHMRNYEALLARVASWLGGSGLLFVHIFTHRAFRLSLRCERRHRLDGATLFLGRNYAERGFVFLFLTRFADSGTVAPRRHALPEDGGSLAREHGLPSRCDPAAVRENIRGEERGDMVGPLENLLHGLRGAVGIRRWRRMGRLTLSFRKNTVRFSFLPRRQLWRPSLCPANPAVDRQANRWTAFYGRLRQAGRDRTTGGILSIRRCLLRHRQHSLHRRRDHQKRGVFVKPIKIRREEGSAILDLGVFCWFIGVENLETRRRAFFCGLSAPFFFAESSERTRVAIFGISTLYRIAVRARFESFASTCPG